MTPLEIRKRASAPFPRYTTDAGEDLNCVGVFLQRRPVEHSAVLSTAATRTGVAVADGAESNLCPGCRTTSWSSPLLSTLLRAGPTTAHGRLRR
jgi:hypothetical protein